MVGDMGPRHRAGRGQGGFALLESVVSLVIAATLVLATIGGLLVATSMTRKNGEATGAEAVLGGVVERLRTMPYLPCATAAQLRSRYTSTYPQRYLPSGSTVEVRWVRHGTPLGEFASAGTPCAQDAGTQLVAVRVMVGERSADAEVVLRDPTARPS